MVNILFAIVTLSSAASAEPGSNIPEPSGRRQGLDLARPTCPYDAQIVGTLGDTRTNQTIDLSVADANVWVTHKVDIDAVEDQCISEVEIRSKVMERGCEFSLLFQADGLRPGLHLSHAFLEADSFCPGWPDDMEGRYEWLLGWDSPRLTLSQDKVNERTADRSCVNLQMSVDGEITLRSGSRKTQFSLDGMSVRGTFDSVGDTQTICPGTSQRVNVPKQPAPAQENKRFNARYAGQLGIEIEAKAYELDSRADGVLDVSWGEVGGPSVGQGIHLSNRFIPKSFGGELLVSHVPHRVDMEIFEDPVQVSTTDLQLGGIARLPSQNFRPAIKLGSRVSSAPVFTEECDVEQLDEPAYTCEISYESVTFPKALLGLDIDGHIAMAYVRAWADLVFGFGYYSGVAGGAEISIDLSDFLYVNGSLELRQESHKVNADDGALRGVLTLKTSAIGIQLGWIL